MSANTVPVVRVRYGRRVEDIDRVAVESPLEVRLHGRPFAVLMRTPGADRELAAGFLYSERILRSQDDLGTIEFCTDPTVASSISRVLENVVNVTLAGAAAQTVDRALEDRRQVVATAACGACGRVTIDALRAGLSPLGIAGRVSADTLLAMAARLRESQPVFGETGGLHAAALFDANAGLIRSAEDVGRHNAVDKVVGRMLMQERLPLDGHVLFVSGRTSFEIVQKAWCAGVPVVAAVSAPSSLAVSLAESAGITLVGFVRDGGCNIYAHPERIAG